MMALELDDSNGKTKKRSLSYAQRQMVTNILILVGVALVAMFIPLDSHPHTDVKYTHNGNNNNGNIRSSSSAKKPPLSESSSLYKTDVGAISRVNKLIYVNVPQTVEIIRDISIDPPSPDDDHLFYDAIVHHPVNGHHSLEDMLFNGTERGLLDDKFKFATHIRHPCDRFVYGYHFLKYAADRRTPNEMAFANKYDLPSLTIDQFVQQMASPQQQLTWLPLQKEYPLLSNLMTDFLFQRDGTTSIHTFMCMEQWDDGLHQLYQTNQQFSFPSNQHQQKPSFTTFIPVPYYSQQQQQQQQQQQHLTSLPTGLCHELKQETQMAIEQFFAMDYCIFGYPTTSNNNNNNNKSTCIGATSNIQTMNQRFLQCRPKSFAHYYSRIPMINGFIAKQTIQNDAVELSNLLHDSNEHFTICDHTPLSIDHWRSFPQTISSENQQKLLKCRMYMGQGPYSALPSHSYTILRDAKQHVLSIYLACQKKKEQMGSDPMPSLDQWLQTWNEQRKASPNQQRLHQLFDCFNPTNIQSEYLGYPKTKEEFKHQFAVVGVLAQMETSTCLMTIHWTGQVPKRCDCSHRHQRRRRRRRLDDSFFDHDDSLLRWNNSSYKTFFSNNNSSNNNNKTAFGYHRALEFTLTPEQTRAIDSLTEYDINLFSWAKELFLERLALVEQQYNVTVC